MKLTLVLLFTFFTWQVMGQSESKPVAIVELFTSQGCSSCPSADQLLREIVNNKSEKGEVIGLSFHVSYWNRLGWKDPYSDDLYTDRQRSYAQQMKLRSMYTPQMIVDGQDEFVGSNSVRLKRSLLNAFERKKQPIQITNVKKAIGAVAFDFACTAEGADIINFAIIQRSALNYVPRGENQYKTLHHANVVRSFQTISFQKSNRMKLSLPEVKEDEKLTLIMYAQDQETMRIGAVGVLPL